MIKRVSVAAAGLGATGALIAISAAGVGAHTTAAGRPDSGTWYSAVNHSANGVVYASGYIRDKLLGADAIAVQNTVSAASGGGETVTSKRTILYTGAGSLTGTSSVHLVVTGTEEKFTNGKLKLTVGHGSQKGHALVATYSGSGSLTTNEAKFTYRGIYK